MLMLMSMPTSIPWCVICATCWITNYSRTNYLHWSKLGTFLYPYPRSPLQNTYVASLIPQNWWSSPRMHARGLWCLGLWNLVLELLRWPHQLPIWTVYLGTMHCHNEPHRVHISTLEFHHALRSFVWCTSTLALYTMQLETMHFYTVHLGMVQFDYKLSKKDLE